MTRNELVKEAHGLAKEKGWWDGKPKSFGECAMLAISEIAEATECVRNNEPPIHYGLITAPPGRESEYAKFYDIVTEERDGKPYLMKPVEAWRKLKPEGELIELADCAIRIADYFGHVGEDLEARVAAEEAAMARSPLTSKMMVGLTPLEQHGVICYCLTQSIMCHLAGENDAIYGLAAAFFMIEKVCAIRGFDLEKAIELKSNYNKTRSYRHGNKAL